MHLTSKFSTSNTKCLDILSDETTSKIINNNNIVQLLYRLTNIVMS